MVDPQTLGVNLAIIIGGLIVLAVSLILMMALLTGFKYFVWRGRRASAEAAERRKRWRPDGSPLPPAGRGICTACARASEVVFHLEDGRRLCANCFGA
jgi:hypothetical protein